MDTRPDEAAVEAKKEDRATSAALRTPRTPDFTGSIACIHMLYPIHVILKNGCP